MVKRCITRVNWAFVAMTLLQCGVAVALWLTVEPSDLLRVLHPGFPY